MGLVVREAKFKVAHNILLIIIAGVFFVYPLKCEMYIS